MDGKRKPYPSGLSDEEWEILAPLMPAPIPAGRPRTTDLREVVNAILYLLRTGCLWRASRHDFPQEGTVRDRFHRWRRDGTWDQVLGVLRVRGRRESGQEAQPNAAILDSQSVKATRTCGTPGQDAGKKVKGTRGLVFVDTLGLLLVVVVHAANIQDGDGAKLVLERSRGCFPGLRLIWADGGYAG